MTVSIGGMTMQSNFMNAACSIAKTHEDVAALCRTSAGAVLIGSITAEPRTVNPAPRWYDAKDYALNSFGMPNLGADYYRAALPQMVQTIHAAGKRAILDIAGFSVDDYVRIAQVGDKSGVDLIEINLGCPNALLDGRQKPIASFDPQYTAAIVHAVNEHISCPLLLKLSPYSNPVELQNMARLIASLPNIAAVVTCNTFPNGYYAEDDTPVIASEYGGVSGAAMRPIVLGQIRQFRKALPESIDVVGVGGVETTEDVQNYIAAGASAVQAATLIVRDGHAALDRLAA